MIQTVTCEPLWPEYRHPKPTMWTPAADRPALFIERASKVLGISVYDIRNNRTFVIADKRRAFAHVAHDSLGWPLHQVKQSLNLKCHSGVLRMIKRSRAKALSCPEYANLIDALEMVA